MKKIYILILASLIGNTTIDEIINREPYESNNIHQNNIVEKTLSPIGVTPNPYSEKINGGTNGGIVGKIDDKFEVSPNGAAFYELALSVPPGTGGMVPQLSITYNSFGGDGMLGWGFNLSGLSLINRAPSNKDIDGKSGIADFSTNKFMLDGNRLISKGENEYSTENYSFEKITSSESNSNPAYFIVKTKSGLIYEYGGSANAQVKGQGNNANNIIFWLVNKVTDTKGNYYTVTYGHDRNFGEYWPERIDYTGNSSAGLSPYCSIRFTYYGRSVTNLAYIQGSKVQTSKKLVSIKMHYQEQCVRTYDLTYSYGQPVQLLSITETGSDGITKYNPTTFTWYNAPDSDMKPEEKIYDTTSLLYKANIFTGDFNGDGKTDIIATPKDGAGWFGWRLFLANSSGTLTYTSSGNLEEGFKTLLVGDYNGDGKSDIVQVRNKSGNYYNYFLYLSTGTSFTDYGPAIMTEDKNHKVLVGEFNGDGANDLFIYYPGSKKCKIIYSTGNITPLGYTTATRDATNNWERGEIGDFNGDGISDVLNLHKDGYDLLEGDGFGTVFVTRNGGWPNSTHHLYLGDFNGDGKTDIFATGYENYEWSNFQINFSTGTGFEDCFIPHYFNSKDKTVFVADINGDGKDDFYAVNKEGDNMYLISYYINDGNGKSYTSYNGSTAYGQNKWNFHFGDFNGDGKTDYLCTSTYANNSQWSGYQLYCSPSSMNNVLNKITDGLSNEIVINYKYMTDASIHTKGTTLAYPVTSFIAPYKLVSNVKQSNGLGGYFTTCYNYANALVHKRGKGVLGFEKFIVKDVEKNIQTTSVFEYDNQCYDVALKSVQVRVENNLVNSIEYINKLRNYNYSDHIHTFVPAIITEYKYDIGATIPYSKILTRNVYDDYGNVTLNAIHYNDKDSVVNVNQYTNDLSHWYLGRLTSSTVTHHRNGKSITRNSLFEYNRTNGLLEKEVVMPGSNLSLIKTYTHDACGNILTSTTTGSGENRTFTSTYDDKFRFEKTSTDAMGYVTTNTTINEATGVITSIKGSDNIVKNYTYDAFNAQLLSATAISTDVNVRRWSNGMPDAPINATFFKYKEITGSSPVLEFYDSLGRILRTVSTGFNGKPIYIDNQYNTRGQKIKTSEPYFKDETEFLNSFEYDLLDRMTKQIYPDNSYTKFQYSASMDAGIKTVTTDPLGQIDERYVDVYGKIIKSVDNAKKVVTFSYDPIGNCTEIAGDLTKIITTYDDFGNKIAIKQSDMGTTNYDYNAFGELIAEFTPNRKWTRIEYDKLGRKTKVKEYEGTTTYSYDSNIAGRINYIECDQTGYGEYYSYDEYNRITEINAGIDFSSFHTEFVYDNFNRLKRVRYPSRLTVENVYNQYNYQEKVQSADGKTIYWCAKKINARRQLESVRLGNNLVTNVTYDAAKGYVKRIQTNGIQDWSYEFNVIGNLTKRIDNRRSGKTELFIYDNLNRLSLTYHDRYLFEEVRYDNAGNILFKTGVGNYSYINGSNKLTEISNSNYQLVTWDEIQYTSFNKISKIKSGNDELQLLYGIDHQRFKTVYTRNGSTQTTYYVGKYYEESSVGKIQYQKNYIFAGNEMVAIYETSNSAESKCHYLHKDHLGSITAYSDETGRLEQELSYDAWGRRRSCENWTYFDRIKLANAWNPKGFTGHEHLDLLELVNMDGRMYDPVTGRFLTPDPVLQIPEHSQGLNTYSYCMNNPLSLTDPSGYSWFGKWWKSIAAAIVGIAASILTLGALSGVVAPLLGSIIGGATGGFTAGLSGALLNGANFGQLAKACFTGAFWGAAGGFLNFSAGFGNFGERLFKHTFSSAWIEGIRGGNMKHGMLSGATSMIGGYAIAKYVGNSPVALQVAANAVVGGTAAELGGGKFANGAITGAFSMLFNDMMHKELTEEDIKKIYDAYLSSDPNKENYCPISELYKKAGGPLLDHYLKNKEKYPQYFENSCALRLSIALNEAGFLIPKNAPGVFYGDNGKYYILSAEKMKNYLTLTYGEPIVGVSSNCIVFETGFSGGVTGHVDVIYNWKVGSGTHEHTKKYSWGAY